MDDQLKRRLMGATIVTALAVIFVPMLFEDKSAVPAGDGVSGMPALPEAVEERAMELPRSAADVAPGEKSAGGETKRAPETGYRIVPLDDAPPKPAQPEPASAAAPDAQTELEAFEDEDFAADEGGEAPEKQPATRGAAAAPGRTAGAVREAGAGEGSRPQPAASQSKAAPAAARPAQPPAKSAEKARPAAAGAAKSAAEKSAPARQSERPAARSPSPRPAPAPQWSSADAAAEPSAKPAPSKAATPASRTAPEAAAKPQAAGAPSSWVVQAGSFTAEANARALVDKLRKQNLPAYVQVSHRESGDLYRVTVGPELSRARAEQIRQQIEGAVGLKGMILPHR